MFSIAKAYAYLYVFASKVLGYQIPGLGFMLRQCKNPRFINFHDEQLYFEPAVASSYGLHIINRPHEPESHAFLNFVFDQVRAEKSFFVDVGANIGIFMVDLARRAKVHVIGFEPSAGCVRAIEQTMAANRRTNFSVFNSLVGDEEMYLPFDGGSDPQGASVYNSQETNRRVKQIKLDNVAILNDIKPGGVMVLMIDVEGYEPNVLRGARELITKLKPLIIFEYNFVSKQHFEMNDIRQLLGDQYDIFRLRKDAMLDGDVVNAWNCVAVPRNSEFEGILQQRICAA